MLILRGDAYGDTGKIRVWQWSAYDEGDEIPQGWHLVDDVPKFPPAEIGINHIMLFNPDDRSFEFITEERELTSEEKEEKFKSDLIAEIGAISAKLAVVESKIDSVDSEIRKTA